MVFYRSLRRQGKIDQQFKWLVCTHLSSKRGKKTNELKLCTYVSILCLMIDITAEEISVGSIFWSFRKGNVGLSIERRCLFSNCGAVFIYGKYKNKTRRKKKISTFLVGLLLSSISHRKKKWSMYSCSWTSFPRIRATPHHLKETTAFDSGQYSMIHRRDTSYSMSTK